MQHESSRTRGSSAITNVALAALVFLSIVLWRTRAYGASESEVARVFGFLFAYVLAPGCLAWAALHPRADALTLLGLGGALGLALQGIARVALGVVGLEAAFAVWPIVCVPLLWIARRRRASNVPEESASPFEPIHWLALAVAVLVAIERTRLYPAWWSELNPDLLFHAGNTAELAHHWPMQNPRIEGLPLTYHFFSYALPAACSEVCGIPIHVLCLRMLNAFAPALLMVEIVAAARLIGISARGAIAAAFLLALHADLGRAFMALTGADEPSHVFASLFDVGLYSSPSTAMGHVFFVAMAVSLVRWLERKARIDLVLATFFAVVTSATKGSVMPVAICGLVVVAIVELIRRRPITPIAVAFAAISLAALPITLWLALGPQSYARALFRVEPLELLFRGPRESGGLLARDAPMALAWLCVPVWIVGFLGPIAPACVLALREKRALSPIARLWLLACGACALLIALVVAAPGLSQLFFAYTGQVALALVAGAGLGITSPRSAVDRALAVTAWILLALMATFAARAIAVEVRRDLVPRPVASVECALFERGLDWIRTTSAEDAVIVSRSEAMIVPVLTERRAFFETGRYSPGVYRSASPALSEDARPARTQQLSRLRETVFRAPTEANLRAVRAAVDPATELLFLWDGSGPAVARELAFQPCPELPPEAARFLGEPLFSNAAIRVYRIPAEPRR